MYMSRSLGVSISRSRSKDLDHQVLVSRSRCLGQVYVSRFTYVGLCLQVYVSVSRYRKQVRPGWLGYSPSRLTLKDRGRKETSQTWLAGVQSIQVDFKG